MKKDLIHKISIKKTKPLKIKGFAQNIKTTNPLLFNKSINNIR